MLKLKVFVMLFILFVGICSIDFRGPENDPNLPKPTPKCMLFCD